MPFRSGPRHCGQSSPRTEPAIDAKTNQENTHPGRIPPSPYRTLPQTRNFFSLHRNPEIVGDDVRSLPGSTGVLADERRLLTSSPTISSLLGQALLSSSQVWRWL